MPLEGEQAPDFTLPSTDGPVTLRALLVGGPLVLAFYAEDATPTCARELASFRDEMETLRGSGARILAVAAGDMDRHLAFKQSLGLDFALALDADLEVARRYGVADEEEGRSRRAVFVIGPDGRIVHAAPWYQPGNPDQFLAVFQALAGPS